MVDLGTDIAFMGVLTVFFTCAFKEKFSSVLFKFPKIIVLMLRYAKWWITSVGQVKYLGT